MSDLNTPSLVLEIKELIIDALGLENISAQDIGNEQTLFGEGLGLDSVDALEPVSYTHLTLPTICSV